MAQGEQKGVTKRTIAILLIMTIFLSVVGTWIMLNAINERIRLQAQISQLPLPGQTTQKANVFVTIHNPDYALDKPPTVTGNVILTVNRRENE